MQFNILSSTEDFNADIKNAKNRIDKISKYFFKDDFNILELGCGRGFEAIELSGRGHSVTAIDIVKEMIEFADRLQIKYRTDVDFICENILNYETNKTFDLICYFDGFGIFDDNGQKKLLNNIYNWLSRDGLAVIDILNPVYWEKLNGKSLNYGNFSRVYYYDEKTNRMIDEWSLYEDGKIQKERQILRCYSLDEITEFCNSMEFKIIEVIPGGAMDYENNIYYENVDIDSCLNYQIIISK